MGMELTDDDLLAGEELILPKMANMVVSIKEEGLSRFAFDKYMKLVGMKGQEAIGGKAYLTNYRLIFKSHGINRLRGKQSIFLPSIRAVKRGWLNLHVETDSRKFKFVMWFKARIVEELEEAKAKLHGRKLEKLKDAILENPAAIGAGLEKWVTAERINRILRGVTDGAELLENFTGSDPTDFLELLGLFAKEE